MPIELPPSTGQDGSAVPPKLDPNNKDSSSNSLGVRHPKTEVEVKEAAIEAFEGNKTEREAVKPGIRSALTSDSKQMPGSNSMKKIFYCWERFVMALSTLGTSGIDKAIKGKEEDKLTYGDIETKQRIEILFEQQELNKVLNKEGKDVKTLYKRLIDFDLPLYLNKDEQAELIEFCKALVNKEMTAMPQVPLFIEKRLNNAPFVNIEGLKTLKDNCLKAQSEKSVTLVANLKAKCLPELQNLHTKIKNNLSSIQIVLSDDEKIFFNRDIDVLSKTIELLKGDENERLKGFDPSNLTPEEFVESYKQIESLSHVIVNLEAKSKLIPKWINSAAQTVNDKNAKSISREIGNLCEGIEKLGDRLVEKSLNQASKKTKQLFKDIQLIAGSNVRVPITLQIQVLQCCKKFSVEDILAKKIQDAKNVKDKQIMSFLNHSYDLSNEILTDFQNLDFGVDNAEYSQFIGMFSQYIQAAAGGMYNTQVLVDGMSVALTFAIGGSPFAEDRTGRKAKEIINSTNMAEGLNPNLATVAKDGYVFKSPFGCATKLNWTISPEGKLQCQMSTILQQNDLSFTQPRESILTFDYSSSIPGLSLPDRDTMHQLLELRSNLETQKINFETLDNNQALKQLKLIPVSLRGHISNDENFWAKVDLKENVEVEVSEEIQENYKKLVFPIVVLSEFIAFQEKVGEQLVKTNILNSDPNKAREQLKQIPIHLRPFVSDDTNLWDNVDNFREIQISEDVSKNYQQLLSSPVEIAKKIDVELAKVLVFGNEPSVDQPLDHLCHAFDKEKDDGKKDALKEVIEKCFAEGILLSMSVKEMNVDQLATLFDATLKIGDYRLGKNIIEEFEKKLNASVKNSSRKVRNAMKNYDPNGEMELLLKYNVLKALTNERGYPILMKDNDNLKGLLKTWQDGEIALEKQNVEAAKLEKQAAERMEQQRLDAISTRKNIDGVYNYHQQVETSKLAEAEAAKIAAEKEAVHIGQEFSADPLSFIMTRYQQQNELISQKLGTSHHVLRNTPLSKMKFGQLEKLEKILLALAEISDEDGVGLPSIDILGVQVEQAYQNEFNRELEIKNNKDVSKAYKKLEKLTDDFSVKVSLLREVQANPAPFLKAKIKDEAGLKDFINSQKQTRMLKSSQQVEEGDYEL